MPRPKGIPKTGGRAKGVPNKMTATAKEALEQAFQGAGGVESLTAFAKEQPAAFYTIWSKIVPRNVDVTSGGESLAALAAAAFGASQSK